MLLILRAALAATVALAVAAPAAHAADRGLDRAVGRLLAAGVPGVVVLGTHDRVAAGQADVAAWRPVRAGDRFRVGSVTKSFVATVVLQLAGEGRLGLDDPVERWLPGLVPNGGMITLRELLSHTSGLFEHAQDPTVLADPGRAWTPAELVALSVAHPPLFAPGAGWSYSNTNYVLLGLVVERVTGRPLRAVLRERILAPLHLRGTSFTPGPRLGVRAAHGYAEGQDVTGLATHWAWAAGSLVSTARDLARFYRALLGGRLLAAPQLAAMKTVVRQDYGLGLFSIETSCGRAYGHNGAVPGYSTNAFVSEDGRRQVVTLLNREPLPEAAAKPLLRVLDAAFCG